MIFWDIRKWDEPVERIILDPGRTRAPTLKDGAPGSCVDFDQGIVSSKMQNYVVEHYRWGTKAAADFHLLMWFNPRLFDSKVYIDGKPAHENNLVEKECHNQNSELKRFSIDPISVKLPLAIAKTQKILRIDMLPGYSSMKRDV